MTSDECKENIKKLDLSRELKLEIVNIHYGKNYKRSCNILINCKDCKTGILFFFSTFSTIGYKTKNGDFNFQEYLQKDTIKTNNKIIATFALTKTGFLDCLSAKLA